MNGNTQSDKTAKRKTGEVSNFAGAIYHLERNTDACTFGNYLNIRDVSFMTLSFIIYIISLKRNMECRFFS